MFLPSRPSFQPTASTPTRSSTVTTDQLWSSKYLIKLSSTQFVYFKRFSDYVAEDTVPSSIPRFIPAHAHPSNQIATITTSIAMATIGQDYTKKKPDASPPGTPSKERRNKKARGLKPTGGTDQTKLGIFHSKEGTKPEDLFPSGLESTPCAFFCSQNKKCTRPRSSCPRPHIVKWDTIKPDDQAKILKHFSNTGNG